ncbi:uncharacterized protein LOC119464283 isoform X1 [Dermacentor silvarum]|uniref:uncharacterized protein LOC119464283 isoform X1 n=1 Tax=Dermacentor silvarum TaxID=543639 RepID=UPI00189A2A03|nr:uncharacterized protein LOC119464283 isoform X1 [Dermacentor silvarum]
MDSARSGRWGEMDRGLLSLSMMMDMRHPNFLRLVYNRDDWSDVMAKKGAREVLMGVKYPDDGTRRSLYASWLRIFASGVWHDSFDHLMLECVAATPSPTTPGTPLFADIFKVHDPVDRAPPLGPVLNLEELPTLFNRKPEKIEPLPESPGLVTFLADLIRKSGDCREALDEAGMIIGFYSLALSVVVAKPVRDVEDFFWKRMKRALAVAVPTSFDGDAYFPNGRFLTPLALKGHRGVVKPYIVLLILGQYAYHVNNDADSSADQRFLEEGFLTQAKFGHLEVVKLLYDVQDKTGLSAESLNRILHKGLGSDDPVSKSCFRVACYLEGAEEPTQRTRPWSRASNYYYFADLDLADNVEYAMRLTAVLAPDPNDQRWQEFADAARPSMKDARLWAKGFNRALRKGKFAGLAKQAELRSMIRRSSEPNLG